MTQLNKFFPKRSVDSLTWSIIDPTGAGDFLTIEDSWNAGQRNMLLSEGDHQIYNDIDVDLSVSVTPIRFYGKGEDNTRIHVTEGTNFYRFDVHYPDNYNSSYDYTQDPPVLSPESQTYSITFEYGTNIVVANNFVWSSLETTYTKAPVIGDFFEPNNTNTLFTITDIISDTTLVLKEYNSYESYEGIIPFAINREILIEMKNLSIGVWDNPPTLISSNGLDDIFDNSSRPWHDKAGIKWIIENVNGLLKYNDGNNGLTIANGALSTGCYVRNVRTSSG